MPYSSPQSNRQQKKEKAHGVCRREAAFLIGPLVATSWVNTLPRPKAKEKKPKNKLNTTPRRGCRREAAGRRLLGMLQPPSRTSFYESFLFVFCFFSFCSGGEGVRSTHWCLAGSAGSLGCLQARLAPPPLGFVFLLLFVFFIFAQGEEVHSLVSGCLGWLARLPASLSGSISMLIG